ncbi:MAG: AMP-binding protein [Clostridiales bacterium]|nr:AMP-binding protein [Clostridiales bacterium]
MENTEKFYDIRPIHGYKDMLAQSAQLFEKQFAFRLKNDDGEYYGVTYPEFYDQVNALGTALSGRGRGDCHVALIGRNCYEWCCSYLAVTCGGGVIVPIDKELPPDDVLNIISVSESKLLFCDLASYEKLACEAQRLPEGLEIICFDRCDKPGVVYYPEVVAQGKAILEAGNDEYLHITPDTSKMSILLFTSGTTGMAKGVMLSQDNVCSDIMSLSGVVKITTEDTLLSILPLHHTYECSLSFLMLMYSGGCVAFCEGLRYITKNMQDIQPTLFVTVPLMLEKIHARIIKKASEKKGGKFALSFGKVIANASSALGVNISDKIFAEITKNFGGRLRMIITGAAAINPEVVKDFHSFGIPVYLGYGLTECSPLVIGNNDRIQLNDSVGIPLPGVDAKITDPDADGIGEICVKGPMIMLGYYNDPEATAQVLDDDGWFHTGDLGSVDADGHYRITGRIKNVIVTKNGKNIYPEEVEYYLNKNPFVAESMVIGEDDEESEEGTRVAAKILPNIDAILEKLKKTTATTEEIVHTVSEVVKDVNKKLPFYKHIKNFDIRETEFIKTTTQKIKRYANASSEEKADGKQD